MTKREIYNLIEAEGIDPFDVSCSAVVAYRVAYYEKTGHIMGFMEAVKEMYGEDCNKNGRWLRMDMREECRA